MNITNGILHCRTMQSQSIDLAWEEISGKTNYLNKKISSIVPIVVRDYTAMEVDFARKRPDLVPTDFMLASLAPLLTEHTNWEYFKEKTQELLQNFLHRLIGHHIPSPPIPLFL